MNIVVAKRFVRSWSQQRLEWAMVYILEECSMLATQGKRIQWLSCVPWFVVDCQILWNYKQPRKMSWAWNLVHSPNSPTLVYDGDVDGEVTNLVIECQSLLLVFCLSKLVLVIFLLTSWLTYFLRQLSLMLLPVSIWTGTLHTYRLTWSHASGQHLAWGQWTSRDRPLWQTSLPLSTPTTASWAHLGPRMVT